MSSSLEILYDFIEAPEDAAAEVRQAPPVLLGILAYAVAGLSLALAQSLSGQWRIFGLSAASLAILCAWQIALGIGFSAVMHLLAEGFGGDGRAVPLFVLLGLSDLAWILALPGVMLIAALYPDSPWLFSFLFFGVGIVAVCLKARSIQHNYRISLAKAWGLLLLPYAALAVFVCLIFFLVLWQVIHQIIHYFA